MAKVEERAPPKIRVLLIEDTDSHADLVKRHLSRAAGQPVSLERADRLATGLARLERGGIDAVLLDLGLPDSDPLTTLDQVLARVPDMPVVVLTAMDDLDAAVQAVQKGAQDQFPKTQISSELLIRSIRYAIERKRADRAVRESERLYRVIGESMNYGIWICDATGRNTYASPSFLALVGLTQEECSSLGWSEALHPDDRDRTIAAWKQCVVTGGMWDIEHRFRGADGKWHPVLARGLPVRDDRGSIIAWAGINLDISGLKLAQEELRSLNETLEQRVAERTAVAELRSRQLGQLTLELSEAEQRERRRLAQVLHDHIQQLLVAARMQLEVTPHSPKEYAVIISKSKALLQQTLDASRSLIFELTPPVLHQRGLVAALAWLARWNRDQYGMEVTVEADPRAEPSEAFRGFLFQAIRELLFNVVKHAGVKHARVQLRPAPDNQIVIDVSDAGKGFEGVPRDPVASDHFGLFSIKERLELLGGRLEIESALGKGSRVSLSAPAMVALPPDQLAAIAPALGASPAIPQNTERPASPSRRIRVLLADDHQILREALAGRLGREPDLDIVGQASDGQMAVELSRELRPDVAILDISMPRLNGIEATKLIRAEMPATRVIGLSMHAHDDMAAAIGEAGAVGFVNKTAPIDSLIAEIRRHAFA